MRIDPDLLTVIYDLPSAKTSWDDVMLGLMRAFRADAGALLAYGPSPEHVERLSLAGRSESDLGLYAGHFAAIDPVWTAMRRGLIRSGQVVGDTRVLRRRTFESTEFYNDFWRSQGFGYGGGGYVRNADGSRLQLVLPRAGGDVDFTDAELRSMTSYFGHMCRARRLKQLLEGRGGRADLDLVARRYGLTPAEINVIDGLIEYGSLRRSADRSGRRYNTVRAQLRAVFDKTGARSQLELMRVIHRCSGAA